MTLLRAPALVAADWFGRLGEGPVLRPAHSSVCGRRFVAAPETAGGIRYRASGIGGARRPGTGDRQPPMTLLRAPASVAADWFGRLGEGPVLRPAHSSVCGRHSGIAPQAASRPTRQRPRSRTKSRPSPRRQTRRLPPTLRATSPAIAGPRSPVAGRRRAPNPAPDTRYLTSIPGSAPVAARRAPPPDAQLVGCHQHTEPPHPPSPVPGRLPNSDTRHLTSDTRHLTFDTRQPPHSRTKSRPFPPTPNSSAATNAPSHLTRHRRSPVAGRRSPPQL